jgi:hypothetical protein
MTQVPDCCILQQLCKYRKLSRSNGMGPPFGQPRVTLTHAHRRRRKSDKSLFMANSRSRDMPPTNWERWAIFVCGVVFVLILLMLSTLLPEPTDFQYLVFRTVLALAAAGVAVFIPGLLHIEMPAVRAAGGLAVFLLVYSFTPAALFLKSQAPPQAVTTYRICSGEYERACLPHDMYQYCAFNVRAWADQHCTAAKILRLDTRDGNKCGYSLDQVICTGPK